MNCLLLYLSILQTASFWQLAIFVLLLQLTVLYFQTFNIGTTFPTLICLATQIALVAHFITDILIHSLQHLLPPLHFADCHDSVWGTIDKTVSTSHHLR